METDPKIRVILGLLTLVALGFLCFWGAGKLEDEPGGRIYYVYFAGSVAGLSPDSQVTYNGITVGKVGGIERVPRPDGIYSRVELRVDDVDVYAGPLFLDGVPERPWGRSETRPWFKDGDRLLSVGGTEVTTLESYQEALDSWDDPELKESKVVFAVERREQDTSDSNLVNISMPRPDGAPLIRFRTTGTQAVLAANLVTGIQSVELIGGRSDLELLRGNQIPAGRSQVMRFLEEAGKSVPQLIASVGEAVDAVKEMLGPESDVREIIGDIRRATRSSREGQVWDALDAAKASFEKISTAVDYATAFLEPGGSIAVALDCIAYEVGPQGNLVPAFEEIRTSLAPGGSIHEAVVSVQRTFDEAQELLEEGGDVAEILKGAKDAITDVRYHLRPEGPIDLRLEEIGYVVRTDLRQTLTRLSSALRTIEQKVQELTAANPSSWITGTKGEK